MCNPLVVDGTVYVGCLDGNLYALSATDGEPKWTFPTGGAIYFSPAYDDGKVYIGSTDMYGYAVDAATGKQVWKTDKLPGRSMNSFWPVVEQKAGAVIFVMENAYRAQQLAALDHEVKAKTWPWQGRRGGIYTDEQLRDLERITIEYFQQYPHRQTFLVIDSATGKQKCIAPVLMVGNAGTRMPPTIGPDGLVYMTIHHDHSAGGLLGGCHAVSYDITKNQFVRCYSYHNLGGAKLVGDEPHGLSMAGDMLYGQHHGDTAGGIDIHSAPGDRGTRSPAAAASLALAQDAQGRQGAGLVLPVRLQEQPQHDQCDGVLRGAGVRHDQADQHTVRIQRAKERQVKSLALSRSSVWLSVGATLVDAAVLPRVWTGRSRVLAGGGRWRAGLLPPGSQLRLAGAGPLPVALYRRFPRGHAQADQPGTDDAGAGLAGIGDGGPQPWGGAGHPLQRGRWPDDGAGGQPALAGDPAAFQRR